MQKLSTLAIGIGIVLGVVAAGLTIGWFATRTPEPQIAVPPARPETRSNATPIVAPRVTSRPPVTPVRTNPMTSPVPVIVTAPAPENVTSNAWEAKLDEILNSESDDTNKVAELFAMFRTLPKEGQEEVAGHLANLVEDSDYAPMGELLKDAKLDEAVLDVLMSDLLNRPNAVKLPLFLDLARNSEHPKAGEARDLLELFLDVDADTYGTDWAKWDARMKEWLKENPD